MHLLEVMEDVSMSCERVGAGSAVAAERAAHLLIRI